MSEAAMSKQTSDFLLGEVAKYRQTLAKTRGGARGKQDNAEKEEVVTGCPEGLACRLCHGCLLWDCLYNHC